MILLPQTPTQAVLSILTIIVSLYISSMIIEYRRDKAIGNVYLTHFSKRTAIIIRCPRNQMDKFKIVSGYKLNKVSYISYKVSYLRKLFVRFI